MQYDAQGERVARLNALDILLAEIDDICYIDYPRVSVLVQQVKAAAEQLGDPLRLARAWNYEAWVFTDMGQLDQSTSLALRALELAQVHNLPAVEARAINIIAANFQYTRDYSNARQLLERQLEIADRLNDNHLRSLALNDLGNIYVNIGNIERSIDLLHQAQAVVVRSRHRGVIYGLIHVTLAEAYIQIKQDAPALEHIQQAIEIFRTGQAEGYVSYSLTLLALIYMAKQDYAAAQADLERAREIAERLGVPRLIAMNLKATAELRCQQGDIPGAIAAHTQALALTQQHQMVDLQVDIYQSLIQISRQLADLDAALRYQDLRQQALEAASFQHLEQRLEILKTIYSVDRNRQENALRELNTLDVQATVPAALPTRAAQEPKTVAEKQALLHRLEHEFRTPLTVIRTGADLLGRYHQHMTEEQRQSHLESITDRVTWMNTMLDDILLLLELSRADRAACAQVINLPDLAGHALQQVAILVGSIDRVALNIDSPTPEIVIDPDLLQVILVQLVSNALKFSAGQVWATLRASANQLVVTVADSGIGIPPGEIAHVATMFYRASNLDEVQGNGLGLALVDQGVTACGGQWHIDSELNTGTTIEVTLPLNQGC